LATIVAPAISSSTPKQQTKQAKSSSSPTTTPIQYAVLTADKPLIGCSVCELLVKHAYESAEMRKRQDHKLTEETVLELTERVCDPFSQEGEWLTKLDYYQAAKDSKVKNREKDITGKCKAECKTAASVCQDIIGSFDVDLSEAIWGGVGHAKTAKLICHKKSKWCSGSVVIPAGRVVGSEEWEKEDPDEREKAATLKSMEYALPPGQKLHLYTPEEIEYYASMAPKQNDTQSTSPSNNSNSNKQEL